MAKETLTYNQALDKLKEIVGKMQSNECDIDQLTAYTKESMALLKLCKEKLTATDTELQKLLAELK